MSLCVVIEVSADGILCGCVMFLKHIKTHLTTDLD